MRIARLLSMLFAILMAGLLVAPGAGHWVQRDRPDLVIPALRDWFARGSDA